MSLASSLNRLLPESLRPVTWATRRYLRRSGLVVQAGPFRGLRYIAEAHCSALAPKIAGTYEQELHPYLARLAATRPDAFIDIGAAEGYYAVGAAVAGWSQRIIAFETEPAARRALGELMALNQLAPSRIDVRAACTPAALQDLLAGLASPAVLMDVEGYEAFLLDPLRIPALSRCTLLVEHHDFTLPGLRDAVVARMRATHSVTTIEQSPRSPNDLIGADPLVASLPAGIRRRVLAEFRPHAGHGWLWFEPIAGGSNGQ
jgi:hypothetical protein